MEHLINHEIALFLSMNMTLKIIYVFNFVAGVVLPFIHFKHAIFLHKTEIHPEMEKVNLGSLAWISFLRTAPFIYSFTVIWSFPLFIAVGLDLAGRLWVLLETKLAKDRVLVHLAYNDFVADCLAEEIA